MGDAQVVSAHEFLRQQGSSYIVLHPVHRLLFLGYGYDEIPRAVPHCIAYHEGKAASQLAASGSSTADSWTPGGKAYDTLVEVHSGKSGDTPVNVCLANLVVKKQSPQLWDSSLLTSTASTLLRRYTRSYTFSFLQNRQGFSMTSSNVPAAASHQLPQLQIVICSPLLKLASSAVDKSQKAQTNLLGSTRRKQQLLQSAAASPSYNSSSRVA